MHRLVAFDLAAGAGFVAELERCFDGGDAVLPLDPRLPDLARRAVIDALRPTHLLDRTGERELERGHPVEPGDALVLPTSGTTGTPKGVVLTRSAIEHAAAASSARLGVDPARDRWCACLPLAHIGGLGVILRALFTGTGLEVLPGFDADAVTDAARRGATLTSLVPTTLGRLAGRGATYRKILLGGAPASGELAPNVVTTYGMTESAGGVVYDGLPLEGVEVRIGPQREIELSSPTLLRAYRDGSDPKGPSGWLATGDAGELTDGRLSVLGRLDERIISGGENIWPAGVEAVLARHAAVAEVAVGGRPDPEWGSRLVAYVVVVAGERPPSLEALRSLALAELGPWSAPRELRIVEALPRGAGGKLQRSALGDGVGTAMAVGS